MSETNKIYLRGHIAKNLVLRHTTKKTPVTNFVLVTHSVGADKKVRASFHQCVAWGSRATSLVNQTHADTKLEVKGILEYHDDPNGYKKCEVNIKRFNILDAEVKEEEPMREPVVVKNRDELLIPEDKTANYADMQFDKLKIPEGFEIEKRRN